MTRACDGREVGVCEDSPFGGGRGSGGPHRVRRRAPPREPGRRGRPLDRHVTGGPSEASGRKRRDGRRQIRSQICARHPRQPKSCRATCVGGERAYVATPQRAAVAGPTAMADSRESGRNEAGNRGGRGRARQQTDGDGKVPCALEPGLPARRRVRCGPHDDFRTRRRRRLRRTTPDPSPDRSTPGPRTVGSRRSGSTTGDLGIHHHPCVAAPIASALGASSSGSGTAYIRWGMIVVDSSVDQFNAPSRGSVTATLRRHGERYGRWEFRLRRAGLVRRWAGLQGLGRARPGRPDQAPLRRAQHRAGGLYCGRLAGQRVCPQRGQAVDLHQAVT